MVTKYEIEIDNKIIISNLNRLINQIYKLLPNREEGAEWRGPLTTIIEELLGMSRLIPDAQEQIFSLVCKLEGLFTLENEEDFFSYRRTIFECISLVNIVVKKCQE